MFPKITRRLAVSALAVSSLAALATPAQATTVPSICGDSSMYLSSSLVSKDRKLTAKIYVKRLNNDAKYCIVQRKASVVDGRTQSITISNAGSISRISTRQTMIYRIVIVKSGKKASYYGTAGGASYLNRSL